MKKILTILQLLTVLSVSLTNVFAQSSFSFIFMSDIHMTPSKGAPVFFNKAIDLINKNNPEFVINGGDFLLNTNLGSEEHADSLYNLYFDCEKRIKAPVYRAIGNREVFGIEQPELASKNPLFGKKMFEKKSGKLYQTFVVKGWKFFILDGMKDFKGSYQILGGIDSVQMEWIKTELAQTPTNMPIVVAMHYPVISVILQFDETMKNTYQDNQVIANRKQFFETFRKHNLKLVLQGQMKVYEDIYAQNIRFITGGSVSGWLWNGPSKGNMPGFVKITIKDDKISSEYLTYGWAPLPASKK